MTVHGPQCWRESGHERCALRAAALHAEQRAAWLWRADPSPEAVAVALTQLGAGSGRVESAVVSRRRRVRVRLSDAQRREMRDMYGLCPGGVVGVVSVRGLAEHFGVSYGAALRVIRDGKPVAPVRRMRAVAA